MLTVLGFVVVSIGRRVHLFKFIYPSSVNVNWSR